MDVLAFSLLIRLVGVLFATTLIGGALWAMGSVVVVSFWAGNAIAPEVNTTLAFGLGGGIAGWFIWRPETESWSSWLSRLPIALGAALLITWIGLHNFGGVFVGETRVANTSLSYGLPGISPVSGAWVGAMIGSLIPFGLVSGFRAFRQREA